MIWDYVGGPSLVSPLGGGQEPRSGGRRPEPECGRPAGAGKGRESGSPQSASGGKQPGGPVGPRPCPVLLGAPTVEQPREANGTEKQESQRGRCTAHGGAQGKAEEQHPSLRNDRDAQNGDGQGDPRALGAGGTRFGPDEGEVVSASVPGRAGQPLQRPGGGQGLASRVPTGRRRSPP